MEQLREPYAIQARRERLDKAARILEVLTDKRQSVTIWEASGKTALALGVTEALARRYVHFLIRNVYPKTMQLQDGIISLKKA